MTFKVILYGKDIRDKIDIFCEGNLNFINFKNDYFKDYKNNLIRWIPSGLELSDKGFTFTITENKIRNNSTVFDYDIFVFDYDIFVFEFEMEEEAFYFVLKYQGEFINEIQK